MPTTYQHPETLIFTKTAPRAFHTITIACDRLFSLTTAHTSLKGLLNNALAPKSQMLNV